MTTHTIELSDYEIANLRAAIEAAGYNGWAPGAPPVPDRNPLHVLNTGDWLGEVYNKLPQVDHPPNVAPEELARRARNFA